jgi:triphosphoribosyl-dephospho-CoA synthase
MLAQRKFEVERAEALAVSLAQLAVGSLLEEARLTPKPGLIDRRGSGAHHDMDLALMEKSAHALEVTFYRMALAGWMGRPNVALRRQIGAIGRQGEKEMMQATGGINTHRGAIWSLGLMATAAAMHQGQASATALVSSAAALARIDDTACPPVFSKGRYVCNRYHVPGAREEAQKGFPHVMKALPYLRRLKRQSLSIDARQTAQINALMAVMAELPDTCVLSRGGMDALTMMHAGAKEVLAGGGFGTEAGHQAYDRLETNMMAANVSPGGAADLLAAAIFLDSMTEE